MAEQALDQVAEMSILLHQRSILVLEASSFLRLHGDFTLELANVF